MWMKGVGGAGERLAMLQGRTQLLGDHAAVLCANFGSVIGKVIGTLLAAFKSTAKVLEHATRDNADTTLATPMIRSSTD